LEEAPTVQSETRPEAAASPAPVPQRRPLPATAILSFVVGLVGVAAIASAAWVFTETRRDIGRLTTDIAQIKLSLELFGKQQATSPSADGETLTDLNNRLSLLEESWRTGSAAAPATLPPLEQSGSSDVAVTPTDGDCLPTGTRFMVASGDVYPVCGTPAKVEIGAVDNGYITLADGTVIAQGGTVGLPASQCMIAVVPSDGGSISGFAEVRVTC
jgi:hypothetical protein